MSADLSSLRIDKSLKNSASTTAGGGAGKKWGVVVGAILLAVIIAVVALGRSNSSAVEVQVMQVAAPVQSLDTSGDVVLNATGYIVAAHKISLAPKVVGRVAWVGVEMGDKVQKDQVLVRLEDDEYKARLLQVKGQLDAAKARLAELLAGPRVEEVARAQAEHESGLAEMENAQKNLDRTRRLAGTNAMSEQAIDDAEAKYRSAQARADALKAGLDLVKSGSRREQIDAQRAQVDQYQGAYDQVKVDFDNTVIKAPLTGTILARNVEVGEYVTTGFVGEGGAKGFVVSIADLNDLRVELDISQSDFVKVALGQPCTVTTDAYPDRKYQGVVHLISPEANRSKATILTKVKILNPDEYLRPDMNASVAFHKLDGEGAKSDAAAQVQQTSMVVPASAVRDGKVFIIDAGKAVERPVEVAGTSPRGTRITSGLTGGETLIVSPPDSLRQGDSVRPQEQ